MAKQYHLDGCGNITFAEVGAVPLSELIEIAKIEYPTIKPELVVIGPCEKNGRIVLAMTFRHVE